MTGQCSTSELSNTQPIPPLAAIFLTHFHDTKGQTVVHYISNNQTKLGKGNIEHTTLPSGLHLIQEDLFGFRHGTCRPSDYSVVGELGNDNANDDGKGDGTWPGVALFRSRENEGGRGRRMVSLGVILAHPETPSEIFELKEWLEATYDFFETQPLLRGAMNSLSKQPVDDRVQFIRNLLEDIWGDYGCKCKDNETPISKRNGVDSDDTFRGLGPDLACGNVLSDLHPIRFLPRLVDILGPLIVVIYKAAITGKRILIYSPPPLYPISAFGWCIAALSLPHPDIHRHMNDWLGQVGLMDLTALHARKEAWVASTSDKILLSHTKLYDLSIDLSSCNPLPDSDPSTASQGQAIIHTTSPSSQTPCQVGYTFSDIPLYKHVSNTTTTSDWWITIYNLYDKIYSICSGVCEYAVGRGQVGSISLRADRDAHGDGEEEDELLQNEDEDEVGNEGGNEGEDEEGQGNEEVMKGQMILKQFYFHSYHLHHLLDAVHTPGEVMTMAQVRELTGKWRVSGDEYIFWSDLARRWERPQA